MVKTTELVSRYEVHLMGSEGLNHKQKTKLKTFQGLVDRWCFDWCVPKIPVYFTHYLSDKGAGLFNEEPYQIILHVDEGEDTLRHEFRHYLIELVRRGDAIEERLCDE